MKLLKSYMQTAEINITSLNWCSKIKWRKQSRNPSKRIKLSHNSSQIHQYKIRLYKKFHDLKRVLVFPVFTIFVAYRIIQFKRIIQAQQIRIISVLFVIR